MIYGSSVWGLSIFGREKYLLDFVIYEEAWPPLHASPLVSNESHRFQWVTLLEERLVSGGSWLGVKDSKVGRNNHHSNIFFPCTFLPKFGERGRRGEHNFLGALEQQQEEEFGIYMSNLEQNSLELWSCGN
eukprot:Gb_28397 [translate_table: standard]